MLWAGLDDAGSSLAAIASALDEALAREFKIEKRAFTPHLTVARFEPQVAVDPIDVEFESEPFEIDRLVLFRCHLRRPAPVYEPLEWFALGRWMAAPA